uniref:Phosphatidylinositol transfer protein N-terminal domain-containing protein n=1 Tax=Erythrolobus australicus TaxID=1077150 RepID=A0A7S1TLE8_9RHOD|mmetsp:Transcript_3543/g.9805  ORF Transcript_3543/g.9805 Transcript_3543/m.9805 type:complete len:265 (+) Transcript_3543:48-842(+)
MLVKEYRLLLPLTAEEYHIAQLYMVAKASAEETGKEVGEGIEIVRNEPYVENEHGLPPGQYTEKIMHLKSKIPRFITAVLPESALQLIERSWNAYPKSLTIYENAYMGESFHLSVESMHANDRGTQANANGLKGAELDARKVDYINVSCSDANHKFVEGEDPRTFQSKKTGRGPFLERWFESSPVCMCAYKVVRLRFKMWGIQTKVEQWGQLYGLRGPFVEYHRKLICWMDEWMGLTMADIRKMEAETREANRSKLVTHGEQGA